MCTSALGDKTFDNSQVVRDGVLLQYDLLGSYISFTLMVFIRFLFLSIGMSLKTMCIYCYNTTTF